MGATRRSYLMIEIAPLSGSTLKANAKRKSVSGNEHRRAGGIARVKRFVCLARLVKLETLVHGDLHRTRLDDREQVVGCFLQLLGATRVMPQRRPCEVERTFRAQDSWREGRHCPARIAEAHHYAAHCEAIEGAFKRILADGIINDRHAFAA